MNGCETEGDFLVDIESQVQKLAQNSSHATRRSKTKDGLWELRKITLPRIVGHTTSFLLRAL